MKQALRKIDPGYWIAALLPLIGILPTLSSGVIRTADGPLHVQRIYAMSTLLANGNLWPRWVPYFHLGYGYPVFNFYPPGTFYLGGLLGLIGIMAPVALTIVTTLAWIVGSVGMYALARHYLPGKAAILAAMLWAYAPSRLFEVWDQGSLPQIMAAALVPWLLLGMIRLAEEPRLRRILWVALPFTGIVFCHQPITFITALYIAPAMIGLPLWAARQDWPSFWKRFGYMLGGFVLSAGLSAIFLLPVALELQYVEAVESPDDTVPYLISNFLQPDEIFMQPPAMDLTDLRFELFTTLGLVGGLLAVPGLIALVVKRRYALALLLLAALIFTLFMLLEISLPVWLTIPYFKQLRFPERFLRVGVIFLSLAGGASILLLPRRWQTAGLLGVMALVLVTALPMTYPSQDFVYWDDLSAVDEIDMELTYYVWGTTSYNEFNPRWGETIKHDGPPEPEEYTTNPLRLTVYRLDMIRQWPDLEVDEISDDTIRVTVTDARPVRFRQYYFPGWAATLDGEPVEIYPEDEVGMITLDVPAGEHTIHLYYDGTPVQKIATLISLLSLGVVAGILVLTSTSPLFASLTFPSPNWLRSVPVGRGEELPQARRGEVENPLPESLPLQTAALIAFAVVGFALLNQVIITPHTLLFRQQSPPDAPVYMQNRLDVQFGDTFELLGYTLNQDSVAPGETLPVTLFWRALRDFTDEAYRPVVQLVNLRVDEAWAVSEPFSPGGGSTTFGYPLDRFASEVHELVVNADTPPYVGRIFVRMVDQNGEPLKLADGAEGYVLEPLIRVAGDGVSAKHLLDYTLGDSVELWCASVQPAGDQYQVDVYWHVTAPVSQMLHTFVHGLDAAGEIVTQQDTETLNGNYPASAWQTGQTLHEQILLPADDALQEIGLGLYVPDGARLTVLKADMAVADDRIIVPLTAQNCES